MAKKDAPNYRKAGDSSESCSTCKAYNPDHRDAKLGTGHCSMYEFFCKGTNTCDAWTAKTENEGIYKIANMITEDPDILNDDSDFILTENWLGWESAPKDEQLKKALEIWDSCDHVMEDPTLAYMVGTEDDSFGPVGRMASDQTNHEEEFGHDEGDSPMEHGSWDTNYDERYF